MGYKWDQGQVALIHIFTVFKSVFKILFFPVIEIKSLTKTVSSINTLGNRPLHWKSMIRLFTGQIVSKKFIAVVIIPNIHKIYQLFIFSLVNGDKKGCISEKGCTV